MDDQELFKQVLNWAHHHCQDLWKEYCFKKDKEKRQHLARKILIEKVKKEPDTELLISPDLKKKILLKEGVDLKRINNEYREKKGSSKVKQEPKIYNQEQNADSAVDEDQQETKIGNQEKSTDSAVDEEEIIDVNLYDQLTREWNKFRWYSMPSIAKKLGRHRKTVIYWRDFGIKINGAHIRLKMIKRPFQWYSKGQWLIELSFFLYTSIFKKYFSIFK